MVIDIFLNMQYFGSAPRVGASHWGTKHQKGKDNLLMKWENQTDWEYKHCGNCGEELQDPSEKAFNVINGYAIKSFYSEEHGKINHKMCNEC